MLGERSPVGEDQELKPHAAVEVRSWSCLSAFVLELRDAVSCLSFVTAEEMGQQACRRKKGQLQSLLVVAEVQGEPEVRLEEQVLVVMLARAMTNLTYFV